MSTTFTVALPVQPMRAVLVLLHDRSSGSAGQVVELDPHAARQLSVDLVQAADLAEARKPRGRNARLAVVSDLPAKSEGA